MLTRADVVPDRPAARVLATLRRALLARRRDRVPTTPADDGIARAIQIQDAVPSASDRRAAVMRALGVQPLLYWRPARIAGAGASGRARVYIDVSGSMEPYVPLLYGALAALRELRRARTCSCSRRPCIAISPGGSASGAGRHDRRNGHRVRHRARACAIACARCSSSRTATSASRRHAHAGGPQAVRTRASRRADATGMAARTSKTLRFGWTSCPR